MQCALLTGEPGHMHVEEVISICEVGVAIVKEVVGLVVVPVVLDQFQSHSLKPPSNKASMPPVERFAAMLKRD